MHNEDLELITALAELLGSTEEEIMARLADLDESGEAKLMAEIEARQALNEINDLVGDYLEQSK